MTRPSVVHLCVLVTVLTSAAAGLTTAPAYAAQGCATGMNDFDGDGHTDVVIGSPNATVAGQPEAGLVVVRSGATGGAVLATLTAPTPHHGDHFGFAVGDVDLSPHQDAGDPCSSVVVGAPGTDDPDAAPALHSGESGGADTGAVFVFRTLTSRPLTVLDSRPETAARFGWAITEQSVSASARGRVRPPVFYASAPYADGSYSPNVGQVTQVTATVTAGDTTPSAAGTVSYSYDDDAEHPYRTLLGHAISGTPVDGEVIAGAPGANRFGNGGQVRLYTPDARPGSNPELNPRSKVSEAVIAHDSGAKCASEDGDRFGASLHLGTETAAYAADHQKPQPIRLFIGVPTEDIGARVDVGAVARVDYVPPAQPGAHGSLVASDGRCWTQDTAGISGVAEAGDRFGTAVQSLALDAGLSPVFVAGAPGEDVGGVVDSGGVASLGGSRWYDEGSAGVPGARGTGDRFGAALGSARDVAVPQPTGSTPSGPGTWSRGLVVGVPGKRSGRGRVILGLPYGSVLGGTAIAPPAGALAFGAALSATH